MEKEFKCPNCGHKTKRIKRLFDDFYVCDNCASTWSLKDGEKDAK